LTRVEERLHPEQRARVEIDRMLTAAGWIVQDYRDIELTAGRGIAVREVPTKTGPVDYLLFGDGKALGTIEAKKEGETLRGVEWQTERYTQGFSELVKERPIAHWEPLPLPFHYQSTGAETLFTNLRDPIARPRDVFHFHRSETLIGWVQEEFSLLGRLRRMPVLNPEGLRDVQIRAIDGLEESLRNAKPKALVNMTMGSGKTYVAVAESYRLLRYGGAERILFLVDRINLGRQAYTEFANYATPDDRRKFTELYNVQVLRSNRIDPAAKVVITTIQRLYSILRGQSDEEFDPEAEEHSTFEIEPEQADEVLPVAYRPEVPIETFDIGFVDECHRSIYGRWGQVLDYFDMSLAGLTATAEHTTRVYFDQNVVTEYKHEQAVADGVNVPYTTYRIKTEVSEAGGQIASGSWVEVRDLGNRRRHREQLEDEVTYDKAKLDRAVVNPDQIRTVVRTFKERVCTEIFPGRPEVPKTVFFCKTDNHAEDVLRIVREEFNRGSDFARKITYKSTGDSDQHIQDFRTDPRFRIAVSVDQIATGTDIRPLECLVFMRMVASRTLFEQMKGRGVRTIDPTDLQSVSEGAKSKDRFVIVDCVGLTEEGKAWVDTRPLERKPSVDLARLLQDVAMGIKDEETVSTIGARLARLHNNLDEKRRQEFADVADGQDMDEVADVLISATDPERWAEAAAEKAGAADEAAYEPSDEELRVAKETLLASAIRPLMKAEVRQRILSLREQAAQLIDMTTPDAVIFAGWTDAGQARNAVEEFEHFVKEHHDEYLALQAYYQRPYRLRPSYDDLKELAEAISKPPLDLTAERLWAAYEAIDSDKVKGTGMRRTLTDLVQLIRFAMQHDDELLPRKEVVMLRFDIWLTEQQSAGREFTDEQLRWLRWMAEHIATSMTLEPEDFDYEPFAQEGGLLGAHEAFGNALDELLVELNEELATA
jgi:type I restriction enzyme, R subunit